MSFPEFIECYSVSASWFACFGCYYNKREGEMQLLVKGTRRIIFILCAFAGCLEILNLQKSALWADRLTCLSEVCNVASLRGLLMLLADFCRFIAVLVNNAFKTVQQSAKDKEDICRRADARQRYLTQDFTLWWAGLRCIILEDCYNIIQVKDQTPLR